MVVVAIVIAREFPREFSIYFCRDFLRGREGVTATKESLVLSIFRLATARDCQCHRSRDMSALFFSSFCRRRVTLSKARLTACNFVLRLADEIVKVSDRVNQVTNYEKR